ncbi:hypothetical protein [Neorhodopirellula lusitana]|uniref:hypothetical protein n=1 Tax=Neorhodopirellula lusitana TaxID=445327 RepID=UPI00384B23FC
MTIQDDKTGVFDLNIRAKRQNIDLNEAGKAELAQFLATKQSVVKAPIELGKWHELTVLNIGPKFDVYIDSKAVGAFSSEGLDHQLKQYFALGVSGKVAVDDVHAWSLDSF